MSRSRNQVGKGWWSISKGSCPAPSLETCLLQFDQFNPVKVSYVNALVYFVFAKGIPGLSLTEERLGGNILYSFFSLILSTICSWMAKTSLAPNFLAVPNLVHLHY